MDRQHHPYTTQEAEIEFPVGTFVQDMATFNGRLLFQKVIGHHRGNLILEHPRNGTTYHADPRHCHVVRPI